MHCIVCVYVFNLCTWQLTGAHPESGAYILKVAEELYTKLK